MTTEIKERPILFSTPMVQAILDKTKTVTRRIVKPQPIDNREIDGNFFHGNHKGYVKVDVHPNWQQQFASAFCPYGKPGDILWVRETFQITKDGEFCFKEECPVYIQKEAKWKPSIHMPKDAARIWLKVTDVRLERLHDITEEDAKNEGAKDTLSAHNIESLKLLNWVIKRPFLQHQFGFLSIWCEINGVKSWESNPWVWVVKFKVLSTTGKPDTLDYISEKV